MSLQRSVVAVGGNFFEDLGKTIGGGLEDIVGMWDNILAPIERNVFRPIGERLSEFEKHNREVFQTIGNLGEGIAREVGPDLLRAYAGIPPKGTATRKAPAPPAGASSGGGVPMWAWIVGGVVVVGGVAAAVLS